MKIIGVIPSRYNSTRFPGKPLAKIQGKTMIQRVYEQAKQAKSLSDVIVATDDERIYKEITSIGGHVIMTDANHNNGTERCNEIASKSDADVIINIQGDEPFIQPEQIELIANCFNTGGEKTQIATLVKEQVLNEELQNPERVKVVLNKNMEALYFSRSIIPFLRKTVEFAVQGFGNEKAHGSQANPAAQPKFYKHIGIYGYRKDVLAEIVKLPHTPLELAESLEQLRWLENGYKIKCAVTEFDSMCIDTPEDLTAVKSV